MSCTYNSSIMPVVERGWPWGLQLIVASHEDEASGGLWPAANSRLQPAMGMTPATGRGRPWAWGRQLIVASHGDKTGGGPWPAMGTAADCCRPWGQGQLQIVAAWGWQLIVAIHGDDTGGGP